MDCSRIREKLLGYVDDDLRVTERLCVDVHLADCARCREELEELKQVLKVCREVLAHPQPEECLDELRARIAEADSVRSRGLFTLTVGSALRWTAVAAVIALMAAAFVPMALKGSGQHAASHTGSADMASSVAQPGPLVKRVQDIKRFAAPGEDPDAPSESATRAATVLPAAHAPDADPAVRTKVAPEPGGPR